MAEQIEQYLQANSLISNVQFGFRKNMSSNDALLYAVENFRTEIDNGNYVAIAMLDL